MRNSGETPRKLDLIPKFLGEPMMYVIRVIKKFNLILSSHQKLRIAELIILMVIGGILETLSVSLILPFMEIVMNPEETMQKSYVRFFCELLGIESSVTFLIVIALSLAVLYILKNIYLLFEFNMQYRFVYGNQFAMQRRFLNTFINRPYEYFLNVDSGEIMRIINTDTAETFSLLITLLSLCTEVVVSGMLIITVFLMAPLVTIIMATVLILLVIVINRIIKPILGRAGRESQKASAGMNKWMLQSIQGIKELKVTAKETYFEERYNEYGQRFVLAKRSNSVVSVIPRFFIEAFSMSLVFVVVAVFIYVGVDIALLIPVMSAVAVAALRLLPSVNRISQALATISYNEPMLDKLVENLRLVSGKSDVNLTMSLEETQDDIPNGHINRLEKDISFHNISYRYPNSEKRVLDNATMTIHKGESIGLVGPSGSGKTTSVDVLLGLLNPQEGRVLIDGVDIHDDPRGWFGQLGYIPQAIFMLDGSIRANVAFGESVVSDEDVWRALSDAALDDFVRSLPEGLDTEIGERGVRLSGGQRQRIGIARALYHNPDVLFFDEATSALDNETEKEIMKSVNKLQGKKTLIIIAHRLTTIEGCDHVYRVEEGKIVQQR